MRHEPLQDERIKIFSDLLSLKITLNKNVSTLLMYLSWLKRVARNKNTSVQESRFQINTQRAY
jgi:hypothetical protein